VKPDDGARIDIDVELPNGIWFQCKTTSGAISLKGLIYRADLVTETGDIFLAAPWKATRIEFVSQKAPRVLTTPDSVKFSRHKTAGQADSPPRWSLRDKLSDTHITYSRIRVRANSPRKLILDDIPIPEDSPVKLPWQAPEILAELTAVRKAARSSRKRNSKPAPPGETGQGTGPETIEGGIPRFSSEVRLVNLTAAVFDAEGHPITGLQREDFEVLEDDEPQKLTFTGSEEVPFNLVLLLDLSGSTRRDRPAMKEAAKRFIAIARPHDRVAAYALANNVFHVISPLTDDRARLRELIENIPQVSGGTPLYDAIVLAYAQELRKKETERNAMIVISDGIDNQIHQTGAASKSSFKKLRQAAEVMNVLIYPIFLDPFTAIPPPRWARKAKKNMQALADTTGGRLFVARSVHDLDPVYPQVAEELRSVYTLAYYPKNQHFDGSWRRIQVRVKRPGARVRTRMGYFAR